MKFEEELWGERSKLGDREICAVRRIWRGKTRDAGIGVADEIICFMCHGCESELMLGGGLGMKRICVGELKFGGK